MKYVWQDKWMDGIGDIADHYILEAVNYSGRNRKRRKYVGAAAVVFLCICMSVSVSLYRWNAQRGEQREISMGQKDTGSKKYSGHRTGGLSVIAYAAAAEGEENKGEEGTALEENVEVSFSEYSPLMSSVPDMPFSFEYSGDREAVEIKVSASSGILRKYKVDGNAAWHVSEESQELNCKSGEKIYWGSTKDKLNESTLTVEVFQDNVSLEKKEILIKWDEDAFCYTAMLKNKEGTPSSQGIIEEAMKFTQRMGVSAPDLLVCNQNYLAFANLKGMIIYDRKKERVASVIDLQEMDCNNFLSDSRHTCVIAEGNEILFFNIKAGRVEKNYYRCSFLNGLEEPRIELLDTKDKKQMLKEKYRDYQKNRRESDYQEMYEKYIEKWSFYSEYGIRWKNEQGEQVQSTLLIEYSDFEKQEIYYSVLHENLDKGTWEKQKLNINVSVEEGSGAEKLPVYQYTGKNQIKKVIYNYVSTGLPENKAVYNYVSIDGWPESFDELKAAKNDSCVLIPYIKSTYGTFDKGDNVVFFGDMCIEQYVKVGDILESMSGGGIYFKAVLEKEGEGYSVKKFQIAEGDGAMFWDSIIKLMKGYPKAQERLENSVRDEKEQEEAEEERKRVIRQYVKNNGLIIHYYKDYGWDKVKLFG